MQQSTDLLLHKLIKQSGIHHFVSVICIDSLGNIKMGIYLEQ